MCIASNDFPYHIITSLKSQLCSCLDYVMQTSQPAMYNGHLSQLVRHKMMVMIVVVYNIDDNCGDDDDYGADIGDDDNTQLPVDEELA